MDAVPQNLSSADCWALLRTAEVGRLAVAVAGQPEIFPVNFVVDHGTVVFRTAEGTKLAALTVSPSVAFEADGRVAGETEVAGKTDVAGETDEAWSVVIKGRSEEVRRLDDVVAVDELPLAPWHGGPKGTFVRVIPREVTGRRFAVAPREAWESPLTGIRRAPGE